MTLISRRIALSTGVELDVTLGGPDLAEMPLPVRVERRFEPVENRRRDRATIPRHAISTSSTAARDEREGSASASSEDAPPILFLHGFPESARTWRHQLADLARDHRVVAPDQRGFARSSKPSDVTDYATHKIVADVIALADALGIGAFTLVGHDWGGAVAWAVALKHPDRVARLIIANAPHPLIFQRSLIDDAAQRAASQYMRAFRDPGMAAHIREMSLETFFEKTFAPHVDLASIDPGERASYLDQWSQPGAISAMLAWYRASPIIVPAPDEEAARPAWTDAPFPVLGMPVLLIWGVRDKALLPIQLEGLGEFVADLRIIRVDAGHFVPWEAPEAVTAAIRGFLADRPATA